MFSTDTNNVWITSTRLRELLICLTFKMKCLWVWESQTLQWHLFCHINARQVHLRFRRNYRSFWMFCKDCEEPEIHRHSHLCLMSFWSPSFSRLASLMVVYYRYNLMESGQQIRQKNWYIQSHPKFLDSKICIILFSKNALNW